MAKKLTTAQRARVRSLMEDEGMSRAAAVADVLTFWPSEAEVERQIAAYNSAPALVGRDGESEQDVIDRQDDGVPRKPREE